MSAVNAISNLLYENWSLENPSRDSVHWARSRVEAVDFAKLGKNHVIACYELSSTSRSLTFELWQVEETIAVDVLSAKAETRNSMRDEVYRIIHANEHFVEGYVWVRISRESNTMEMPGLARTTIHVVCISWRIKP